MATPSKLRQVTERLYAEVKGYPLSEWVADQRDAGLSWRSISAALANDLDVTLTDVTLISWFGASEDDERGAA